MKNIKRMFAVMLAAAMLMTCMAFNMPLTAENNSSRVERFNDNGDYPVKSLNSSYNGIAFNAVNNAVNTAKGNLSSNAFAGGTTVIGYSRNKFGNGSTYQPYAAWVMFDITDPANTLTELSRGGVEFYESAYDGELIYGLDTDNNFYSVDPETFEATRITSVSGSVNTMTYDWEHDTFYILDGDCRIRELRKDGSLGTAITPGGGVLLIAPLAYIGNGEFMSLDFMSRKYVKIDMSGNVTMLADSDGQQGWSASMTYNRNDGKCYICYTNLQNGDDTSSIGFWSKLYAVDTTTGESEFIDFIGEELGVYVMGMFFADFAGGEEPEHTLDEAMNLVPDALHFETDGDYPWVPVVFKDILCGASGNQDRPETSSTVSTTVQLNAGDVLRFDWAVSCREDFEEFAFAVNGTDVEVISGMQEEFTPYDYVVTEAGEYTFSWTYRKQTIWSEGQDRGFVRNVYTGAPIEDESVSFAEENVSVRRNLSTQFEWTVEPYYAYDKTVTFTSSNTDIAVVDANGVVYGIGEGTAVITATTQAGNSAQCVVTVIEAIPHTKIYAYQTQTNNMISFFADDAGHIQQIGTPAVGTFAMTYAHGVVYGVDEEGYFFTSTPGSTQMTRVGHTGASMITSMAYNYADSCFYAVGYTVQSRWDLYRIDPATGIATVVGQPQTTDRDPLWTFAITTDGRAYGITASSGILYQVDLATAETTEIGFTGCPGVGYCQSLIYDHDNNIMLWAAYWENDSNGMREVDLTTGMSTAIGDVENDAQICGGYMVPSWDDPSIPQEVTITFVYMVDGEWVSVPVTVAYGEGATAPAVPSEQPHEPTALLFVGWDIDFTHVYQDMTVTAQYAQLGDVDMDGEIRISDATIIARRALGLVDLDEVQLMLADVDRDGEVTFIDAVRVLRIAMGLAQ